MTSKQPQAWAVEGVTGMHPADSPEYFTSAAMAALAVCGFVTPAQNEAWVVVCDCAGWAPLARAAQGLLGTEERQRAARFRFERDQHTYILSHALWRVALGVCLHIDADEVPLTHGAQGQPRIAGATLSTSLSHGGSWMAMAICNGATVGVDVERSPSRSALAGLMPSICTPIEIIHLMQDPVAEREMSLLALWTRKEALLKAFGIGLNVQPSLFSAIEAASVIPPPLASITTPCRVFQLALPAGLVGALAVPETVGTWRLGVMNEEPG